MDENYSTDSLSSDDSEYNFIPGYVSVNNCFEPNEIEQDITEQDEEQDTNALPSEPYENEPLADEGWLLEYRNRLQERQKRKEKFVNGLKGIEKADRW